MSTPIDDEVYGERSSQDPDEVRQGNPGRPQSDFEEPAPHNDDDARQHDGAPAHPTGERQAAENIDNEPAG